MLKKKLKGLVLVSIHDTLVENHPLLDNLDGIKKRSVGLLLGYLSKNRSQNVRCFYNPKNITRTDPFKTR